MYVDARVCVCVLLNINNTNFHTYEVLLIFFSFHFQVEKKAQKTKSLIELENAAVVWGGVVSLEKFTTVAFTHSQKRRDSKKD